MDEKTLLRVRLTPKGGQDALMKREAGLLYARVAAPPVDGAANRSLIALLAKTLRVAKSRITLQSGETAREKVLCVEGLSPAELDERLKDALEEK